MSFQAGAKTPKLYVNWATNKPGYTGSSLHRIQYAGERGPAGVGEGSRWRTSTPYILYGLPLNSTTVVKAPPAAPYRAVRMLFPLAFALIDSEVRQINRNPYYIYTLPSSFAEHLPLME